MSYAAYSTRDRIGEKPLPPLTLSGGMLTLGDLDMNDQSVVDALNAGLSQEQVAQLVASGTSDAQLESMAFASGVVSNESILTADSVISGIPNWAFIVLAIFLLEIKTWNAAPAKRSRR